MENDLESKKQKILEGIFLKKEDTLKKLEEIVRRSQKDFSIDLETLEVLFKGHVSKIQDRILRLLIAFFLMKEKDFVINEEGQYFLSMHAQKLLPYFSQILKKEVGVLPVILGIVRNKEKILLIKRRKMPYKDYWGLFGGKQINGETIAETIEREIFEEAKINAKMEKINGIVYERLVEKKQISTVCQLQQRSGLIFGTNGELLVCNSLFDFPIGEKYIFSRTIFAFTESEFRFFCAKPIGQSS